MKAKHITMRIIDLIMTGNLLFLMALQVTRQLAHEWIGIAMTVLFVVHHIFNYKYYKTIFKGKYNFFRVFQLLISVLLLASFVLTAFSGMTMSRFATPFMNGFLKASDARKIHLAISYWSYVLMGVHIGLHFGIITAKLPKGIFRTISAVIMTGISIWGFMLFLNANIFNYMFMQTHFAFLDYEKAAWLVILENFIMLISWAFTAYLLSLFIKSITAIGKKDKKKIVFTILYAVGIVVIMGVGTLMHFVTSGGSESSILAWNTPAGNTSQTAENDNSKIRTENGSPDNTEQNNTEVKDNYVLIEGGSFMMGSPETENWRISDETQHEVTLSDFYISAYEITQAEYLSVMGVPENISENEKEKIYDNPELAVKIGRIDGWMILGRTMFEHDIDLYKECDAISGSLEFVCSALMENNGPVAANYMTDMFYIDEIEINEEYYSEDVFSEIIDELPDSLFTHYHVWSEILIYYPRPLPHEDKLEELEKELAARAYSDVIDRNFNGNVSDESHLIMSMDQFNIIAGRRRDGQSYPEVAKDTTLWERYEKCGFEEWLNTRVMYKMIY